MKIGIIGSGVVAKTLGGGFFKHGHEVALGTREAGRSPTGQTQKSRRNVGRSLRRRSLERSSSSPSAERSARDAAVARRRQQPRRQARHRRYQPDRRRAARQRRPRVLHDQNESLMERLQKAYPAAHFVKAFNSVGAAQMVNPKFASAADDVHLRQRRRGEEDGRPDPRSVRLGDRGHGSGRGGARDRAALHALVHPRRRRNDWSPQRSSC